MDINKLRNLHKKICELTQKIKDLQEGQDFLVRQMNNDTKRMISLINKYKSLIKKYEDKLNSLNSKGIMEIPKILKYCEELDDMKKKLFDSIQFPLEEETDFKLFEDKLADSDMKTAFVII